MLYLRRVLFTVIWCWVAAFLLSEFIMLFCDWLDYNLHPHFNYIGMGIHVALLALNWKVFIFNKDLDTQHNFNLRF